MKIKKINKPIKKAKELTTTITTKTTNKITKELSELKQEIKQETKRRTADAIIAAFAFLIAFSWRDTIKEYTNKIISTLSLKGPTPLIQLYAALLTTIICVLGIIIINKWAKTVN